jgi:hypothetical protein
MRPLNTSTAQLLNDSGSPLNARPAEYVAADFRLQIDPTLFPGSEAKAPRKHSTTAFWNLVLNEVKCAVLSNCWLYHNPVPPL